MARSYEGRVSRANLGLVVLADSKVPGVTSFAFSRLLTPDAGSCTLNLTDEGHLRVSINGETMDMDVINERVPVGQWEIWEIANASMMAHPFHIHNTQFRVIERNGRAPPPLETGYKDTVVVNPREQVRVLVRFEENTDPDLPYMYHCHILEHEDAGMMGQFVVMNS